MPVGATQSTTSNSMPKQSRRRFSRLDSSSGSSPTTTAPATGPATVPAPPIITTSTNRIDCRNENIPGVTMPCNGANSPPASPARAAENAKPTVLTTSGLTPMDAAAVSLSRTARIAAPQLPRAMRA
ncbi:hypothetical protein D3C72_1472990 [compost metagenome]